MNEANKRPWVVEIDHPSIYIRQQDREKQIISAMLNLPQTESNVRLIVKAVNMHDELVEALKPFANITRIPLGASFTGADVNRAEQVLSRAEDS